MSLDQTLAEIEPIFRDGTFVMPSFQEVLTAKQFAEEINSGALSVRDAYLNFWSYVEDAELWGLPKDREWRSLLPDWRNLLPRIEAMLSLQYGGQLFDTITRSYWNAKTIKNHVVKRGAIYYNPFYDDFELAMLEIWVRSFMDRKDLPIERNEIVNIGATTLCGTIGEELESYSRQAPLFLLDNPKTITMFGLTVPAGPVELTSYTNQQELLGFVQSNNLGYRWAALERLAQIGDRKAIICLMPYLKDESIAKEVCYAIRSTHQRLKPQGYNPAVKRLAS